MHRSTSQRQIDLLIINKAKLLYTYKLHKGKLTKWVLEEEGEVFLFYSFSL